MQLCLRILPQCVPDGQKADGPLDGATGIRLHKIQERPIAENGEVVIRPMMYLALSYDHRLIDGKESVQFLVSIKSFLEDPSRLLLGL